MPDKEWTDQDTDWLDAGWADMSRQLDIAMPVAEPARRRRGLLWWWSGIGILLLFLLAWRTVGSTTEYTLEYFPLPGTGEAQVNLPPPPVFEPAVAAIAPAASAPGQAKSAPVSEPAIDLATRSEKAPATLGTYSVSSTAEERAFSIPDRIADTARATAILSEAKVADRVETAVELSELSAPALTSFAPITTLSTSAPAPVVYSSGAVDRRPLPLPLRSSWQLGTELTGHLGLGGANGATIGVLAHWETRRRLSLEVGLRYHTWAQTWGKRSALGNNQRAEDNSTDSTGLVLDESVDIYPVNQVGGQTYRILVARDPAGNPRIRTHFLELPVRLNYRFRERWAVNIGLRPALLLNSSVELPAVVASGAMSSLAPTAIALSNRASQGFSTAGSGGGIVGPSGRLLQRWHLGWEAGLTYRIAPHWSAGAYYRRGQSVWQPDSELESRTGLAGLRIVRWW